ncbi:50S ribosomal protein L14e [Candidatus Woesearchaeota archaeon]|nr:50S ribosomal protein L14e [Candidatus Woesearchaeota archaeon]
MLNVGRLAVKTAGREAGQKCVIVDVLDNLYVTIDGNVRRKKCNIAHLQPLDETIELQKGASHADVIAAFKKLKILKEPKAVRRKAKDKA